MNIKSIIKKTCIYKKLIHPMILANIRAINQRKHELFVRDGHDALKAFVDCMDKNGITYWLEFGTLLGVYRDGDFVPNELDLDVGVYLRDAQKVFYSLTSSGFELVREFHVIGENGLEQTYKFRGTTIDLMFFYEKENLLWCNGAVFPNRYKLGRIFEHKVTAHHFERFDCTRMSFKDYTVSVPANTEEHLIEIFGPGYKVYDPDFKVDYNKVFYEKDQKKGFGFIKY